ncbi:MAG: hypothetical protein WKF75_12890 [Singulisphaera sp.]
MNESHRLWTEALAAAAHTTPDRVALHCVHQHNAPFIDRDGNTLLRKAGASSLMYVEPFVEGLVRRSAVAVREALTAAQPVTHVHVGTAEVEQVASNRRVLGPDGKVRFIRTSATKNPVARAEPEGTVDPVLKSIGFSGRPAPGPPLLLHHPPDELLWRRSGLERFRRHRPRAARRRGGRRIAPLFHRLGG